MYSRIRDAVAIIALTSIGLSGASCGAECKFAYDEKLKREIVYPTLVKYEGSLASNFDIEKPGIVKKKKTVRLIFVQKNSAAIDTPNFIIVFDPCKFVVIEAGETTPTLVTGGPASH